MLKRVLALIFFILISTHVKSKEDVGSDIEIEWGRIYVDSKMEVVLSKAKLGSRNENFFVSLRANKNQKDQVEMTFWLDFSLDPDLGNATYIQYDSAVFFMDFSKRDRLDLPDDISEVLIEKSSKVDRKYELKKFYGYKYLVSVDVLNDILNAKNVYVGTYYHKGPYVSKHTIVSIIPSEKDGMDTKGYFINSLSGFLKVLNGL